MRRLLACLAVVATTAALTAPAATSAEPVPTDSELRLASDSLRHSKEVAQVPNSAVSSATARANVRTATWTDTSGDGPIPARDLRRLSITHNRKTGLLNATFRLGTQPRQATTAATRMYAGFLTNGQCHARSQVASLTHKKPGTWATYKADGTLIRSGNAAYSRAGATVRLKTKAKALRKNWTCAFARLSDPSDNNTYDDTGYVRLQTPPRPKLQLSTPDTRVHTSGAVNGWKRIKVRVDNKGDVKATRVRVRVSSPKGVQVKPRTISFKPIKAGGDRTKVARIKLKKRATRTVRLTATAKNAVKRQRKLVIHPKPRPLAKNLVGRYFWGFKTHPDFAWDNYAVAFVNKRFAYVGFPKRGIPKCGKVTKRCKRFVYNKRTGKLKVGGKNGRFRKGKLVLGGIGYYATQLPKPGARWNVTLENRGFIGCQAFTMCRTWRHGLTLRKNGTFTRTYSSITTVRDARRLPAGRGSYRVKRKGHLVLNYRKGKTRHATIAIDTDRMRRPDVYGEGLILDNINFYP